MAFIRCDFAMGKKSFSSGTLIVPVNGLHCSVGEEINGE